MTFYTSLSGLKDAQTALNVISNNIANGNTNGFKESNVQFSDIVAGSAYTDPKLVQGIGAKVEDIQQDFSQGSIEQTGSALDLAINGDGFFSTKSVLNNQINYTRNGGFTTDGQGFVVDGQGNRLQVYPVDASGNATSTTPQDAQVPAVNAAGSAFAGVTVGTNGNITASFADGSTQIVGKVALATFIAPTGLLQTGSSNWQATGISGAATYGQPGAGQYGQIMSGAIETSNVDISQQLISLISAQQNFQANSKAIDTESQIMQTIINLRG